MLSTIFDSLFSKKKNNSKQIKTLFIVTYGRSGSTLLQRILNSIDGYCIRGENNDIITSIFYSYKHACYTKHNWGKETLSRTHPWYGADLIDPRSFGFKLADLFISEILQSDPTSRVVGFKEIRYFYHTDIFEELMDFLLEFFPEARIIFNKRNPEAVSKSDWWTQVDPENVYTQIQLNDKLMEGYTLKYPQSCYFADYDNYSTNVKELKKLFDFLGENYDEEKLKEILSIRLNTVNT